MTNISITPTQDVEKRVKAIAYFGNYSRETALRIHKKNAYKDIQLTLKTIQIAVIEAKRRYFNNCSFVKIIVLC